MTMMTYTIGLALLNAILTGILTGIYVRNYRSIRAQFSLGLLMFAAIFLIQKLVSIYIYMDIMYSLEHSIALAIFFLEILQVIAFSILVWITLQ
jgi:hypothetical protein